VGLRSRVAGSRFGSLLFMKTTFIFIAVALMLSLVPASALITEADGGIIYGETLRVQSQGSEGFDFRQREGIGAGVAWRLHG